MPISSLFVMVEPFITGQTRQQMKPFVRLMEEYLTHEEDAVLKEIVYYAYSHGLVEDYEEEVIVQMMQKRPDFWEEIGRKAGFEEKILERGREKGKIEVVKNALRDGLGIDIIMRISGFSEQVILEIQASMAE